jgi:hypothetical protein
VSKETRRDIALIGTFFLVSATGMASVFLGPRLLAWIVIVISDFYLFIVLLLAALRSDDESFLDRHPWVANFFPRRTAAERNFASCEMSIFERLRNSMKTKPTAKEPSWDFCFWFEVSSPLLGVLLALAIFSR